jgi:hypothetical protein
MEEVSQSSYANASEWMTVATENGSSREGDGLGLVPALGNE